MILVVLTLAVLFSLCGFVIIMARRVGMSDVEAGACLIGGCILIVAVQQSGS